MRLLRNVSECAITIVAIQDVRCSAIFIGRAIINDVARLATVGGGKRIVQIIHDKQVEQSVVVIVNPSCCDRPRLAPLQNTADARFLRSISEGADSIVMKELITVKSGHI